MENTNLFCKNIFVRQMHPTNAVCAKRRVFGLPRVLWCTIVKKMKIYIEMEYRDHVVWNDGFKTQNLSSRSRFSNLLENSFLRRSPAIGVRTLCFKVQGFDIIFSEDFY